MEYRQLGNSDLMVSITGLGGNTFGPPRIDEAMTIECIHRALDLGINFVDTAIGYGSGQSEIFIGNAIRDRAGQLLIATKYNVRRQAGERLADVLIRQIDESLRKLQVDHIDLWQGSAGGPGSDVDSEELLHELQQIVKSGKVRYVGLMNTASWRMTHALDLAREKGLPAFVSQQHNYNIVRRQVEFEVLPACAAFNVGFLPNATLAGGYLTDKYSKGQPAPEGSRGAAGSPMVTRTRTAIHEDIHDQLKTWAHERDHTLGDLALAWLAAHKEVASILTGVSTPEQVEQNVRGAEWKLTPEELAEIDKIAVWDGSFERIENSVRQPGEA